MAFEKNDFKLLGAGFFLAVFSSFGQTYFIGVYRQPISDAFALTNSDFGLYYMLVTLGSAIGLNRLGHLIDGVPLGRYAAALTIALSAACLMLGLMGPLLLVFGAMMLVRLVGQGMMTHAAMTTMSRYFSRTRGRAVAIAGLGMPVGQAIFPPLAVLLMTRMDWQQTWAVFGAIGLLLALPLFHFLLKDHDDRHARWLADQELASSAGPASAAPGKVWRRKDVVRDWRFYLLLPALIVTPFWITAVFFFAEDIALSKGWSMQAFTGFYWIYALGAAATPLLGGALVDHFGGRRLVPWYPPIMALGLAACLISSTAIGIGVFLALMGLVLGAAGPINNAMWAEIYGTRHLGEIKALATSLLVLSTALAPFLLGRLLDAGIPFSAILIAGIAHSVISSVLAVPVAYPVRRSD